MKEEDKEAAPGNGQVDDMLNMMKSGLLFTKRRKDIIGTDNEKEPESDWA